MKTVIVINQKGNEFGHFEVDDPSRQVAGILRDIAERIDGHPHFSPGHSQPITIGGKEIGSVDVYRDGVAVTE